MKLQRREKILAGSALGLVGLAVLWFLFFSGDSRSFDQLIAEQTKLASEIENKQKLLQAAILDAKRLAQWQRRALPPDPVLARSLYQNWLRNLATRDNLRGITLASTDAGTRLDQFTRIPFKLRCRANLGDLVDFLYEFYSVGYLHQIRSMNIKPIPNSRELDVSMTIEALSLPMADSKSQLPKEASPVLQLAKRSDYREPIVKRDLFTAYVRPTPLAPTARREQTIDPGDYVFVTGFTEVDGTAKVWIKDRTGDKLLILASGESFTVGKMSGKIEAIRPEGEVIIEFDGRRRQLRNGDNLHGGVEIQDEHR
ncbi:MAG: hypothetical protein WCJ35_18870 [Planctomycetota bacterium]